ncbi:N-acetylmuramidase family protein [Psychrobacter aquaticus]|uniref:Peptidoglycan-binding domain 1 n=1 Tax=Psychrobacter aquaticus CMS 56 TaxID=1354303 RepID=U4TCG8_9GAMM|nr:N-acetylmuramidase family protein [Psychrobacter aquaticus]ERL56158.1 Peptidoglycan-binding domain 1 [Psychrobacter aquaticus CMS 56]
MSDNKPMMTDKEFFDWSKIQIPDNTLTQDIVDEVNKILRPINPADLQKVITILGNSSAAQAGAGVSSSLPVLTRADIVASAKGISVEAAALKSVIDVECPKPGFGADGLPTILFEPHKMWKYLTLANFITKRDQLQALFPDMCNQTWDKSLYNVRTQHEKLAVCKVLHWDAAHMSCSWGKGQVMGFNWQDLKYPSLKAFIDAMHTSEAAQIDAMCRFIKVNGLVDELQRNDWAGFAYRYNGEGYKANQYDIRLAAAYKKAKREGW